MYAILDIETTGGQFNEEGITEIAIYKFDGHEIVDQFISLVNPEIPIQPFVVKLTGINNAMLRTAPKFYEVAKRIIEITEGCILVAHNASFDYRILRTEFRRLGYDFQSPTLCTVELAQKLLPEQLSHSLGKLVRALGIAIPDRHRASGDAMATVKLFKILLEKDVEKTILKELIKTEVIKGIAPRLLDIIESLPSKTGIFYIHREDGTIIHIGKSRNIRKKVNQFFTGTSTICKKIQLEVFTVSFELTGSELIAALKELEEIDIHKPVYNKSVSVNRQPWSLYYETNKDAYLALKLKKTDSRKREILSFPTVHEARATLHKVTADYNLCQAVNGLQAVPGPCAALPAGNCFGACMGQEDATDYNKRVRQYLEESKLDGKSLILLDRGRSVNERSAVLVEEGRCKGYAFYDLNYQVLNPEVLHNILVPVPDSKYVRNMVQTAILRSKSARILKF